MAVNPTVYFDGDKKRIYEVPNLFSVTTDGNGFRVYTPTSVVGRTDEFVALSFQKDIWSKFQDWHKLNEWAVVAIGRTGGAPRSIVNNIQQFATNDYSVLTSKGWKFVPANYPHTLEIFGNVFSDQSSVSIFDATRVTSIGVIPYVRAADSLQVVTLTTGSGVTAQDKADISDLSSKKTWDALKVNHALNGSFGEEVLSTEDATILRALISRMQDFLEADIIETKVRQRLLKKGTSTVLLDKNITGSQLGAGITVATLDRP